MVGVNFGIAHVSKRGLIFASGKKSRSWWLSHRGVSGPVRFESEDLHESAIAGGWPPAGRIFSLPQFSFLVVLHHMRSEVHQLD